MFDFKFNVNGLLQHILIDCNVISKDQAVLKKSYSCFTRGRYTGETMLV